MNSSEFAITLEHQLNNLPIERVIEFGVDLCKRLIPDYIDFYKSTGWGNPLVLEEGILYVCNDLNLELNDAAKLLNLISKLEAITPDTEDFGDVDSSYAINAAGSLIELLEYVLDENLAHIINISSNVTDTLDFKVWEQNGSMYDQLNMHPEIIVERKRQLELTKY